MALCLCVLRRRRCFCLQAANIVVATPSSACHISLAKQLPAEEDQPNQHPFGKEYPYQSVNSAEGGGDAGENFKVMPMPHPILLLAYTSPSSLLLVRLLFSTSDSQHAVRFAIRTTRFVVSS